MIVKNNCWKKSEADWVIIVDIDEFVYHPNMLLFLQDVKETIIIPAFFEMMHDKFPATSGQIYEEVQMGFPIRNKVCMFRPKEIIDMNYEVGMHDAFPEGNIRIMKNSGVVCMHMRHLGIDHVVNRNTYLAGRQSEINKNMQWGYHVNFPREEIERYFELNRLKLVNIIELLNK
jgi:hypothetical protein